MNSTAAAPPENLDLVLDVPVSLSVEMGSCQLAMREVLQLGVGSIVQLDQAAGSPVELRVNGKLIARGEVIVMEDRLSLRITELVQ